MVKKRALFSLFDQKNAVNYAKRLLALGWEIVATRETFTLLNRSNLKVKDFSSFFGINGKYPFPPTLHPALELALTQDVKNSIDLVYITTYPLSKGNDVGGHTIIALAAKGERIAVFDREGMEKVIEELSRLDNQLSFSLRQELIKKINIKISKHYESLLQDYGKPAETERIILGEKSMSLLEGENPYQIPSDLFKVNKEDALALSNFIKITENSPCFTNMADFDSILQTICILSGAFIKYYGKFPYIAIAAKHGNPCGLAVDWDSPSIAVENALLGNKYAIFGGEVIVNFTITENLIKKLFKNKRIGIVDNSKLMLDLIIAPDFENNAVRILKNRKSLKLFKNKNLRRPFLNKQKWSFRMVRGGFLRQPPHNYILDFDKINFGIFLKDKSHLDSLIIAWVTAWNSSHGGNEVAVAKNRMLVGAAGGPATTDSCQTAINRAKKCGHNLQDSVFAANAFFPFIDGPKQLVKAGCIGGVVPEGGKNFELVEKYFNENRLDIVFLNEKFRGFCRH